jgi:hypothetical protein
MSMMEYSGSSDVIEDVILVDLITEVDVDVLIEGVR